MFARVALVGLACVMAHGLGAFDRLDFWIFGSLAERTDRLQRDLSPLLVALDARTLDRWGPPPWSTRRWDELAAGLKRAGVAEAYLLEPANKVLRVAPADLRSGAKPGPKDMALIRVPTVMFPSSNEGDRKLIPISLQQRSKSLRPWDAHLHLAAHEDGVVRDLSAASDAGERYGRSAFCEWLGACPQADTMGVPLHVFGGRERVPMLSALDLLEGQIRLSAAAKGKRLVFIGVTAPAVARFVHVGPRAARVPFPEAVTLAVARANGAGEVFVLGRAMEMALLLVALLVSIFVYRFRYFAIGPITVGLLSFTLVVMSVLLYALGLVRLPLTALFLVGLVPPVVTLVGGQRLFRDFLETARSVILREGFRYTARGGMVRSYDELHIKLGALARNYAGTNGSLTFRINARKNRVELFATYGVKEDQLRVQSWDLRQKPWAQVLLQPAGVVLEDIITVDGLLAYLLPLSCEGEPAAIWLIPFTREAGPPNAATLSRLVRWITPRLALGGGASRQAHLVNQMEAEVAQVRELFAAASEERRQQLETFKSINAPLLVADVSGTVIYSNSALHQLSGSVGLGTIGSIRELIFKLQGERGLAETMSRIFGQQESVRLSWSDKTGRTYHVKIAPVVTESADGQVDINGYISIFQDLSLPIKMKDIRASVVQYASSHIRDKLMAIVGYTGMIEEKAPDPATRTLISIIQKEARDIEKMTAKLRAVIGLDSGSRQVMPTNFVEIIYGAMDRLALVAKEKEITFRCNVPEAPLPVMVAPGAAQEHFVMLLREACLRVPRSSQIEIEVEELEERSRVEICWPGSSYDEDLLHMLEEGSPEVLDGEVLWMDTDMDTLSNLYRTPQEIFGVINVYGSPGAGATISFSLPRV